MPDPIDCARPMTSEEVAALAGVDRSAPPDWQWVNGFGETLEIRESALWHSDAPEQMTSLLFPVLGPPGRGIVLSWEEIHQIAGYMKDRPSPFTKEIQ